MSPFCGHCVRIPIYKKQEGQELAKMGTSSGREASIRWHCSCLSKGTHPRGGSMQIKTILVPCDFSEYAEYAFTWALGLAESWGAKLILLHAAPQFGQAVRGHWGSENGLHWGLEGVFQEDQRRRRGHAAQTFTGLRHPAPSLLRQEKSRPPGMKAKRLKRGWGKDYLPKSA